MKAVVVVVAVVAVAVVAVVAVADLQRWPEAGGLARPDSCVHRAYMRSVNCMRA